MRGEACFVPLRRTSAVLAAVWLVAACSTLTPEPAHTDFALPEAFASIDASGAAFTAAERWWEDFGDARLNQWVDTALVQNPGIAQAMARERVAQAQARLARADGLPQLALGAGTTRQRQSFTGLPRAGEGTEGAGGTADGGGSAFVTTNHNVAFNISWELDLWGRVAAQAAATQADWLISGEQLRAMRQSVAAQVVQMYFEIVHAHAQVALSEATVESLTEMARQINNRVAAGIASPADGMLASANLDAARAGLQQRSEALARAVRQLEVVMGAYPAGQLATAQVLPDVPAPPSAGVPAELLARRPDVRAAELALQSAGYRLAVAERSFLPALSLSGSAGVAGSELSELFRSSNLIWSIAGNLLQPIFQGGRLVAQVDSADAQRDESLHAYAETALGALAEVETALAIDRLLTERERALDASASAAEEAQRVSLNRYLQGIDPFLNVLESQQRALDGRSAHISAHHARLENRIALHLALGGGFEDAPRVVTSTAEPLAAPRP